MALNLAGCNFDAESEYFTAFSIKENNIQLVLQSREYQYCKFNNSALNLDILSEYSKKNKYDVAISMEGQDFLYSTIVL